MSSKEKLKIAMFGHKRVPSREGGIEIVVGELATHMAALGHEVTCYNRIGHHISGQEQELEEEKTKFNGVRIKSVWTIDKRGLAAITSSFSAAICCAIRDYDVVHIHAEGPATMCWIPKIFRKKVIVTVHGLDHKRAKWGKFASWYIMTGEKNAVKYADEIIVLSKSMQNYFMTNYRRKTVFIPNGVSKPKKREVNLIRTKWGLEKDNYVLFIGRLVPEKGIQYLLEAWRNIETDKKLVIAGCSSDSDEFEVYLHRIATDNIIFTGFVQGQLIDELYSNTYLFVLPSDLEGMPISLLEAMSYGNCCLVSDIPECKEVVEDNALTFSKSNVMDLQQKLQLVIDIPSLVIKYRKLVSEYVNRKYDWNKVTEETLQLYQ